MKGKTRQQLAVAGLVVALAAIGAPAGQAAFPDSDSPASPAAERVVPLAQRVRSEPGPPALPPGFTVELVPSTFDWADAGVGAGIAVGVAGLLAGGVLVVRRGQRDKLATP
jgi:hypothetical protein